MKLVLNIYIKCFMFIEFFPSLGIHIHLIFDVHQLFLFYEKNIHRIPVKNVHCQRSQSEILYIHVKACIHHLE